MMSLSGGSLDRARAGSPSVTRFIHRSSAAESGNGRPNAVATIIVMTSPRLHEKR